MITFIIEIVLVFCFVKEIKQDVVLNMRGYLLFFLTIAVYFVRLVFTGGIPTGGRMWVYYIAGQVEIPQINYKFFHFSNFSPYVIFIKSICDNVILIFLSFTFIL